LVVQEKGEHDAHGCLASVNRAAKAYNKKLSQLCDDMRFHLKDATIVYTDMFSIKYGFVANHTKYGMKRKQWHTLFSFGPSEPEILSIQAFRRKGGHF
jgi:hypothetical protein